jgi:hypothetical protein
MVPKKKSWIELNVGGKVFVTVRCSDIDLKSRRVN